MKYKILELDIATRYIPDGYDMSSQGIYSTQSIIGMPWNFNDTHTTMEGALAEIEKFEDKLKYKTLTILPIIEIG